METRGVFFRRSIRGHQHSGRRCGFQEKFLATLDAGGSFPLSVVNCQLQEQQRARILTYICSSSVTVLSLPQRIAKITKRVALVGRFSPCRKNHCGLCVLLPLMQTIDRRCLDSPRRRASTAGRNPSCWLAGRLCWCSVAHKSFSFLTTITIISAPEPLFSSKCLWRNPALGQASP
jgi:hypothetical protein